MHTHLNKHPFHFPHWLQRFGLAGFLFFFIKGMLWLSLPALAGWLMH